MELSTHPGEGVSHLSINVDIPDLGRCRLLMPHIYGRYKRLNDWLGRGNLSGRARFLSEVSFPQAVACALSPPSPRLPLLAFAPLLPPGFIKLLQQNHLLEMASAVEETEAKVGEPIGCIFIPDDSTAPATWITFDRYNTAGHYGHDFQLLRTQPLVIQEHPLDFKLRLETWGKVWLKIMTHFLALRAQGMRSRSVIKTFF